MNKNIIIFLLAGVILMFLLISVTSTFKNVNKIERFNGQLEQAAQELMLNSSNENQNPNEPMVPFSKILDTFQYLASQMGMGARSESNNVDLKDYILKSTVPPIQKCPACICPKIKVSC